MRIVIKSELVIEVREGVIPGDELMDNLERTVQRQQRELSERVGTLIRNDVNVFETAQ